MNIVVLAYHRIGGSGVVAYETGRALAQDRGHHVHFMGLEPPFRLADNYADRMEFHRVWVKEYAVFDHQPYALALASQLADLLIDKDIDIIHSHYALPHAISAIWAREIADDLRRRRGLPPKKVKVVTTLHGTDITVVGSHRSLAHITRLAIDRSDEISVVSEWLKAETIRHFETDPDRIRVIHNFVNPAYFNPELRNVSKVPHKNGCKTIVHVSNLREVKDPLAVVRIFAGMLASMPCLELFVVGEGPMRPDMEGLAREMGVHSSIRFLGIRNNIGPILASCDLSLLPSRNESFGLAALEAMACGCPVLASRAGGLPEVVEDGVDGFLFDPDSPEEAVRKGLEILSKPSLAESFRARALLKANETFAMPRIVDQYEKMYAD